MRQIPVLLILLFAGCSTHPLVNTLDFFKPGKMYANEVEPYGGVLNQGSILAPGGGPPGFADPVPTVPGVVPPPVPLPSGAVPPPPPVFPK